MPTFGPHLRQLRERRGLSLRELAESLDVSCSYLSQVERDLAAPPTQQRLLSLAYILEVDPDRLFLAAGRIPKDVEVMLRRRPELLQTIRAAA